MCSWHIAHAVTCAEWSEQQVDQARTEKGNVQESMQDLLWEPTWRFHGSQYCHHRLPQNACNGLNL